MGQPVPWPRSASIRERELRELELGACMHGWVMWLGWVKPLVNQYQSMVNWLVVCSGYQWLISG